MRQPTDKGLSLALVVGESLVLDGLTALFRSQPDTEVVATAATSSDCLKATALARPRVTLIDVSSPSTDWTTTVYCWRREVPEARLVLLDEHVRDSSLRQVLRQELHGYAVMRDPFAEIVRVIREVAAGEQAFSVSAQQRLFAANHGWQLKARDDPPGVHSLTQREIEVLTCLTQGVTVREASTALHISPSTIENHKARIMRKLRVRRMVDLVRFAIKQGIA